MNCKEGDVALVVNGQFMGAICEVIALAGKMLYIPSGQWMVSWFVKFPRAMPWGVLHNPDIGSEGLYPDAWLRPLPKLRDEYESEESQIQKASGKEPCKEERV